MLEPSLNRMLTTRTPTAADRSIDAHNVKRITSEAETFCSRYTVDKVVAAPDLQQHFQKLYQECKALGVRIHGMECIASRLARKRS